MFKSKPEAILLVYAKGGHAAQMQRFLLNAPVEFKSKNFVALTDVKKNNENYQQQYYCIEARSKYSNLSSIPVFVLYNVMALCQMIRIMWRYRIVGLVSTGPGIALVPSLICRLFNRKVVYFESWSRVFTPSLAGKVMYKIADLFFIQHESMHKYYPKAVFAGRL